MTRKQQVAQAKDFMLNNDLEVQIIKRDRTAIKRAATSEGLAFSDAVINEALSRANSDPYIVKMKGNRR